MSQPSSNQKVWLITGSSSGFGRYLVEHILSRSSPNEESSGDLVIATSRPRSLHTLDHLLDPSQNPHHARLRLIPLDVTDSEDSIRAAIDSAVHTAFEDGRPAWGRIDVLVNNAGFGPAATLEEGGVEALKYCYETNVFGQVKVTNAVIPVMRGNGGGKIVFIGSRSAFKTGGPLTGLYTSSKAALHALVDTYATELAPFGIKVIGVQPGAFRTNTVRLVHYEDGLHKVVEGKGAESIAATEAGSEKKEEPIVELSPRTFLPLLGTHSSESGKERGLYQHPSDNLTAYKAQIDAGKKWLIDRAGKEPGDPEKAVKVLVDVVKGEGVALNKPTPKWLTLGRDSVEDIRDKCALVLKQVEEWEEVACATDV